MDRGVKGPVDRPLGGARLGECKALELNTKACDLTLDLSRINGVSRSRECSLLTWREDAGLDQSLKGRACSVVTLDHLRTDPFTADELLLGEDEVRISMVELEDPVQQGKLGWSVKAQVADELSNLGPVLLLDVRSVVLVSRS